MLLASLFNLIRWKNLVIILITQALIKYALTPTFKIQTALSNLQFIGLVTATLCIAAAGYIINDVFDLKTDSINKPQSVIINKHISEKSALRIYYFLSFVGLIIGFIISYTIGKPIYVGLFIIISLGLYYYSKFLKSKILIGNIIVAFFIAFSLLIVIIFDVFPINPKVENHIKLIQIVLFYAFFAFIINLIREIIKDIEDIDGDYNQHMKTLPIVIGRKRTQNILIGITAFSVISFSFILKILFYSNTIIMVYSTLFILAPLLYFTYKLYQAETKKDFTTLSKLLKIILSFGMISLLILSI